MEAPPTTRHRVNFAQWSRRSFLLCILMLGAGVFFWGTAYKMSLYEGSPIHDKVPAAKLSTQASTANKEKVVSAMVPRNVTTLSLLINLAVLLFALDPQSRYFATRLIHSPSLRLQRHFSPERFLRPPPSPLYG